MQHRSILDACGPLLLFQAAVRTGRTIHVFDLPQLAIEKASNKIRLALSREKPLPLLRPTLTLKMY